MSITPVPVEVQHLQGWCLLIIYNNGEKRVCDCSDIPTSKNKLFEPLKDFEFFKKARIDHCTLVWNDDLDCCPDGLYQNSIPYHEWLKKQQLKKL